jgi:alpha-beta hydrolase superfamily lysophospholipase
MTLDRPERPAQSYAEARARFDELLRGDTQQVDPNSRSQLLGPDHETERAIVFLHGLTNSPQQFAHLAERFVARGYSVLIPRIPYHGYLDRMTTELAQLSIATLVDTTSAAVDLAAGLADDVTVCGLSLGGVLAIWAAQYRAVALAVPMAPSIGAPMLPVAATSVFFGALGRLPNRFVWWDPRVKLDLPGPKYAYPRYPTHALVETQRLGMKLLDAARSAPPRARSVCVVSNAADIAVSNVASDLLVKRWRAAGASHTDVWTYQFPRHFKLFHDLVDPLQPNARPGLVYPILEQIIIERREPQADAWARQSAAD